MKKILSLIFGILLVCGTAHAIVVGFSGPPSGDEYSDIIFYHDADAKDDANKAGGSATVTYSEDFDLLVADNSGTAIHGSDSWDTDNDGYQNVSWEVSGNIDFDSGVLGFYVRPQELVDGHSLVFVGSINNDEFEIRPYNSGANLTVRYKGAGSNFAHGMSIGTTYFLEFIFNGSTCTVEVDGTQIGQVTGGTGSITSTDLYFGADNSNIWDAHIDQVIISNDETRDLNAIKDNTSF